MTDEHDRGSAHRVGDANQCAGIAGLTDLHTDGDKSRILREHIRQDGARVFAHRYYPGGSDSVRQRFCRALGDELNRGAVFCQQPGVALCRCFGDEDLADQPMPGSGLHQVGALDQKAIATASGHLPVEFDGGDHPGRSFGQHRLRLRSDCRAART